MFLCKIVPSMENYGTFEGIRYMIILCSSVGHYSWEIIRLGSLGCVYFTKNSMYDLDVLSII